MEVEIKKIARQFLDITGWPHPDNNLENDILDSLVEFAEQYHKAKLKELEEWAKENSYQWYDSTQGVVLDELLIKLKEL